MTNNSLLFLLVLLFPVVYTRSIDSCTRLDSCASCANSTDHSGYSCRWCISSNRCTSQHSFSICRVDDTTLNSYNCPSDISHLKYDEEFMRQTVLPLVAATMAPDKEKLYKSLDSCFQKRLEIINTYEVFCDEENITTCFAYSVYMRESNAMAIVFRGTSSIFQFIDEGISFFIHKRVPFEVTKGEVDGYYLGAFRALWEEGIRKDFERLLEEVNDVKLWFFGHSLGGGLASIASTYTGKVYNLDPNRLKLVTFGMPRIGDLDLAQEHDRLVPDSWRIEHGNDPIPSIPLRTFPGSRNRGSFHHKSEIWYPRGMALGAAFEIGSRPDTTVGRSLFPFNMDDHLNYFDVCLETWYLKACDG